MNLVAFQLAEGRRHIQNLRENFHVEVEGKFIGNVEKHPEKLSDLYFGAGGRG